jgi:hypothetical protein
MLIGGTEASAVLFQFLSSRYENGHPTIVTTNRGLPKVTGAPCSETPVRRVGHSHATPAGPTRNNLVHARVS